MKIAFPRSRRVTLSLVLAFFASPTAWCAVDTAASSRGLGAGGLDDWLALGLAVLAALCCTQQTQ